MDEGKGMGPKSREAIEASLEDLRQEADEVLHRIRDKRASGASKDGLEAIRREFAGWT